MWDRVRWLASTNYLGNIPGNATNRAPCGRKLPKMAATDLLSDKAIQAAIKAAVAEIKPKKISDGGGLLLIARPTGTGWWRMRYWIDSKEGMMSLGTYPEISLKDARKRRDEIKRQVANGEHPGDGVRRSLALWSPGLTSFCRQAFLGTKPRPGGVE